MATDVLHAVPVAGRPSGRALAVPSIFAGDGKYAALFAFLCFFPYPAVAIGQTTGLQVNEAIAVAAIPFLLARHVPMRHFAIYLGLIGMLLVTGLTAIAWTPGATADLVLKSIMATMIAVSILIPGGFLARRVLLPAILTGACCAIVVHGAVSVYQIYSYQSNTLPFVSFYNNPSFMQMSQVAENYALYIHRPFGLFPEPSAMTSSLGPWLILLVGVMTHKLHRNLFPRWGKALAVTIIAIGFGLMLEARSGYTPIWAACLTPIAIIYPIANAGPGRGRPFRIIAMIAAGIALVIGAAIYYETHLGGGATEENASWQSRMQSIVIAITAPSSSLAHFIAGFGPGQAAPYIVAETPSHLLPLWDYPAVTQDVNTVWSVFGTIYMEAGLIGLLFEIVIVGVALRAILRSSAAILGSCVLVAWLAGVILTTSYFPLSPIWLIFSLLLAWDRVFPSSLSSRSTPTPTADARTAMSGERHVPAGVTA